MVSINTSETWHGHGNFSLAGIETEPSQRRDIIPREQLEITQPVNNYKRESVKTNLGNFLGLTPPTESGVLFLMGKKDRER